MYVCVYVCIDKRLRHFLTKRREKCTEHRWWPETCSKLKWPKTVKYLLQKCQNNASLPTFSRYVYIMLSRGACVYVYMAFFRVHYAYTLARFIITHIWRELHDRPNCNTLGENDKERQSRRRGKAGEFDDSLILLRKQIGGELELFL